MVGWCVVGDAVIPIPPPSGGINPFATQGSPDPNNPRRTSTSLPAAQRRTGGAARAQTAFPPFSVIQGWFSNSDISEFPRLHALILGDLKPPPITCQEPRGPGKSMLIFRMLTSAFPDGTGSRFSLIWPNLSIAIHKNCTSCMGYGHGVSTCIKVAG